MFPGEVNVCSAKMSVSSSLLVNRSFKVKCGNNSRRSEIKHLVDNFNDLSLGELVCTKCVNCNGNRLCDSDVNYLLMIISPFNKTGMLVFIFYIRQKIISLICFCLISITICSVVCLYYNLQIYKIQGEKVTSFSQSNRKIHTISFFSWFCLDINVFFFSTEQFLQTKSYKNRVNAWFGVSNKTIFFKSIIFWDNVCRCGYKTLYLNRNGGFRSNFFLWSSCNTEIRTKVHTFFAFIWLLSFLYNLTLLSVNIIIVSPHPILLPQDQCLPGCHTTMLTEVDPKSVFQFFAHENEKSFGHFWECPKL